MHTSRHFKLLLLAAAIWTGCSESPQGVVPPDRSAADMMPDLATPDLAMPDVSEDQEMTPTSSCPQDCASVAGTSVSCEQSSCVYTCEAGRWDWNNDLGQAVSDGCEGQCVASNGGVELCDGVDNDCDGEVDEDFSDLNQACQACGLNGTFACAEDQLGLTCVLTEPAPEEVCDGEDNNCDGTIDEGFEDKGKVCVQGTGVCADLAQWTCSADKRSLECLAQPRTDHPSYELEEQSCDNLDNDCDGEVDEGCDDDMDMVCDKAMLVVGDPMICPLGKDDCDDQDPEVYPGAPGKCDGKDNNCNNLIDELAADQPQLTPHTFNLQFDRTPANIEDAYFDQAPTLNGIEPKTPSVMAAAGSTGFCFVGVDRRNSRVHLQWLRPDGTSARQVVALPTTSTSVIFNIMDVKVGLGAEEHCAFLLSESGNRGLNGNNLKYKGRIHAGLWRPDNANIPVLLPDLFKHEVSGGPAKEWFEYFANYAAMTSYLRQDGMAQREVFGIFIHDPRVPSSGSLNNPSFMMFSALDATSATTSPLVEVKIGGGINGTRKSTRYHIAAYAKSEAEQLVYFSQYPQVGLENFWGITTYDAATATHVSTMRAAFSIVDNVRYFTTGLFPFAQDGHGYLFEPFEFYASRPTEHNMATGTITGQTKRNPFYRTRNLWAPALPTTQEAWLIDAIHDRVITLLYDPARSGNTRLKLIPFGATPFNELLAIGQINGKIYAFDMLRFGAAAGTTPAQARLYPFGCQ